MSKAADMAHAAVSLRRIVGRFAPEIRRQWALVAGASAAMLAEVCFRLIEPWPLKIVFDYVLAGNRGDPPAGLTHLSASQLLLVAALGVVAATGLRALASYLATVGFALAGNRVMSRIRQRVFAHVLKLGLQYHAGARRGDLISRMTSDVGRLQDVAVSAALPLASHLLTLAGMLLVMFLMNPNLGLVAIAVVPLFVAMSLRIGKRIRVVARKQRHQEGELATTAAETINAIRVVQVYALESDREAAFAKENKASLREGVRGARLAAGLERSVDLVIAGGTAAVLWYGAHLVMRGEITPGDLIVFMAYLKNAFKPMRDAAKFTGRLAKAAASGERILQLLDTPAGIADRPGARDLQQRVEVIAFDHLSFYYEPGHDVLHDVSLTARRGECVAVVGPSGAGKSTLVNLLLRLVEPTGGRVLVGDDDVRQLTLASLRRSAAAVLQESVLFAGTVAQNIAVGKPGATEAEIVEAARVAGAHDFIGRLPRGYQTHVGERGDTLSGGQRQRIALARAAIRRAPILVLDEPTAGLDQRSKELVLEAVERLARETITLIISHDLAAAERADRIVFLDHGRVVEQGTHAELLALGGGYAAMWTLQTGQPGQESADALAG